MRPRVSILLPVYDAAATLPACLRSIARQTEERFECVIVDDGSRDGSLELARRAARGDGRFQVIAAPHRGLVPALELGLEHCRAPIVARMDADDWMHRRRLEHQLAALYADARLAAVGCHVRLFPRRGLGPGMRAYERWLCSIDSPSRVLREVFVECPVAHPTLAVRTSVLRALRYRDVGWPEDYDLVLRMLEARHAIGVVPRRLLGWRQGGRRLSRTGEAYRPERFTACKAEALARSFLAGREHYVLWGYGGTGRSLCRALASRGKRPCAIVELHPRRIGRRIQGAEVIRPEALGGPPGAPIVVSVAGAEPRSWIRAALERYGYREGLDFVCAA